VKHTFLGYRDFGFGG